MSGVPAERRSGQGPSRDASAGSVTAELAVGLSTVMMVVAALLGVVRVGLVQLQVSSAAAAAARSLARGDPDADIERLVAQIAGPASVALERDDVPTGTGPSTELVAVQVSRTVVLQLPGSPTVEVSGRAVAVDERASP